MYSKVSHVIRYDEQSIAWTFVKYVDLFPQKSHIKYDFQWGNKSSYFPHNNAIKCIILKQDG